jgi:hypothetical protein
MAVQGVDFENAIERNSRPVLDRKRVLGGLELDEWALSVCLRLNVTFQAHRIRASVQSVREPSEPWTKTALLSTVECVEIQIKICAR